MRRPTGTRPASGRPSAARARADGTRWRESRSVWAESRGPRLPLWRSEEKCVASASLCSPEGGFLGGLVANGKMRRVVTGLPAEQTLDSGGGQSSGKQGPLHRISRFAGEVHRLAV